jgi:hypothetical protein
VTRKTNIIKICELYAPTRDRDFYDDYVDDMLSPAERKKFEKHLETCMHCSRKVAEAIERDEAVESSCELSEIGLRKSRRKKMQWKREILNRRNVMSAENDALAASLTPRMNMHGVAYGVAVDPSTGHGDLLECIAVVANAVKARSKLEIRAMELRGLKLNGVEETITTPADHLEDILNDIFITSRALVHFRLWEKTIRVEVNNKCGCGIIHEAESAALAVLIAIVSAVTGKKVNNNILFSAGIRINGFLEGVGDIAQKIQVARYHGMKACFTADEIRPVTVDKNINQSGIALHYFKTIDDVFNRLKLITKTGAKKTDTTKKCITPGKKKK